VDTSQAGEPVIGDAFGLALLDYLEHGSDGWDHFVERDDGLLEFIDPGVFFESESDLSATEAVVLERAGHRVLDIGAGAGAMPFPSNRRLMTLWLSTSPRGQSRSAVAGT